MASVKFYITGDNSSAMRALGQVQSRIKGLSSTLTNNFKSAVAGAFGVAAIVGAVRATINYADNIDKIAQRLGVTTEYVQVLQTVARDTGKDFAIMEKAMVDVADAAQDVLDGNTKKGNAFKLLGVDEKDLKSLSSQDLMTKAMGGVGKLGKEQGLAALSELFGKKSAGALMGVSDKLANPKGVASNMRRKGLMMDDATVAKLADIQDTFEELLVYTLTKFGPGISGVFDWIADVFYGFLGDLQMIAEALGIFSGLISDFDIKGLLVGLGETIIGVWKDLISNVINFISGKKSVSDVLAETGKKHFESIVKRTLGENSGTVAIEQLKSKRAEITKDKNQRLIDREARRLAREKSTKDVNNVNRVPTVEDKDKDKDKDEIKKLNTSFGELKGGSSDLSIGGLAGINAQYRLERLNQQMADSLDNIEALLRERGYNTPSIFP